MLLWTAKFPVADGRICCCMAQVQHGCDSTHGQSGSPMWDSNNNVRAVLTGGNNGGVNWAVQVDDFVFNTILGWMKVQLAQRGCHKSFTSRMSAMLGRFLCAFP